MVTKRMSVSGIAAAGTMLALLSPTPVHAAPRCPAGYVCVYNGINPNTAQAKVGTYGQPTFWYQPLDHPQRNFSVVNARVTGRVQLKVRWAATGTEAIWCLTPGRSTAGPGYVLTAVRIGWSDSC
ncbi:hypothetical protein [Streptomyces sp. NPDC002602]|uniref:hypothetical protein n=1 Tax=Streptomyces sp. NPDC002602 TaxID=3364654 RepID=UPI00368D09D3